MTFMLKWWPFVLTIYATLQTARTADYQVGVGRADCTGPAAEVVFMGYAKPGQKGCGLHLRQFSRAFIFDDGKQRAVFVTVDACMMAHGVKMQVIKNLKEKYNDTYSWRNVIISGTHTHGAPGGFNMEVMLDISILGFVQETFDALVKGITLSIIRAHESMTEAKVFISSAELLETNINRSPASYLFNPEEERARYKYNVDKTIVQIKIVDAKSNEPLGAINWFPVHPTSMNNTNCLVTSDNVGLASVLLEKEYGKGALPGHGKFVGAFASTNLGDVSPNIKGPKCINTGEPCDSVKSTCGGSSHFCIASGPGKDMFESTEIIAGNMFKKAQELLKGNGKEVKGPVKYIHQFVNMPNQTATITLSNGTTQEVKGCLPAMGYSFAAGTTDGPGEFDFTQATNTSNPFWNTIRDFIFPPTPEDVACQHPKPILINTGRIDKPYEWHPKIVATQMFLVGNVALAAVPGEFTTMSGRRLKETVQKEIVDNGGDKETQVILTGLSNVYTHYIATPEEYQLQRYEGASTIYGPHTLTIYLKLYRNLAHALVKNSELDDGPTPPKFPDHLWSLVTPVLFDTAGWMNSYGDCILQPAKNVATGQTVVAKFISGHPRNNVEGRSFLSIEKWNNSNWVVVANDATWETKFIWRRRNALTGSSEVEIQWTIPKDTSEGVYRIGHFGYYKFILGGVFPYKGYSTNFTVSQTSSKEFYMK